MYYVSNLDIRSSYNLRITTAPLVIDEKREGGAGGGREEREMGVQLRET